MTGVFVGVKAEAMRENRNELNTWSTEAKDLQPFKNKHEKYDFYNSSS